MKVDAVALRRDFGAFVAALKDAHQFLAQWIPDLAIAWERELLLPALTVEAPEQVLDDVRYLAKYVRVFWGGGPLSRSERYIPRPIFEEQLRLNNELDDKCGRASLAGDALLARLEPKPRYR